MQPLNDTTLINSLHAGAPSAYNSIFHQYSRSLLYFIISIVHDEHIAEDIAAEAFSRTFRKNTDFETLAKLKSFLFTTASNAALDHVRAQKRHATAHNEIRYLATEKDDDTEQNYIYAEAIREIYAAIEKLPGKPREVIRLEFVDGKTLPEIAAALNISYNTVQNHKAKGLELLRNRLVKNRLSSTAILMIALTLLESK